MLKCRWNKFFNIPLVREIFSQYLFPFVNFRFEIFLLFNRIEGREVVRFDLPQWSKVEHLKLPKLSSDVYVARLVSTKNSANVKFFVE